jgi:hypothetical protein
MQTAKTEASREEQIEEPNMAEVQAYAEELLAFAAKRYNGGSDSLRLLVVSVEGPERWWDLYLDLLPKTDLCQTEYRSPTTADNWDTTDGYAVVLQEAVSTGLTRIAGCVVECREIRLLEDPAALTEAARLVFTDFDRDLADRVSRTSSNAVILLNSYLIRQRAAANKEYMPTLICHECLHLVEEASGLILVHDADPNLIFDEPTTETFREFKQTVGEAELKRRYPTLF